MPKRLTRADHERIQREMKEPPKPQPPERLVRMSCGHEVLKRVDGDTTWYETKGVCGACRGQQMLSGYRDD